MGKAGGKAAPQAVYRPSGMTETLLITRADGGFRGILPIMMRGTIIAFSAAVLAALALVAVLSDSSEAETIDIDGGQYELNTVNSMLKRKMGETVYGKTMESASKEIKLTALAHNLRLILEGGLIRF